MENGPCPAAKIEARFYGEDPQVLRHLAAQAETIFRNEPTMDGIRHNWRNQVPVILPQLQNARTRETGISKQDLDNALLINFSGKQIGLHCETSHLLPIVARAPVAECLQADSLWKMQIWSSENNTFVPATQVVNEFSTEWENSLVMRRDRIRILAVLADPKLGSDETADSVYKKVRRNIEDIQLPSGYRLEWGG
jgi:multidrug efflux pump subunit AcrB